MSLTAGVLSLTSSTDTKATVASTAASGGTGPYTEQLYMSTTTGFSPGVGNIIAGATALSNIVSGLIPNTTYFFKMVYTDTGNSNVTVTSAQLTVVTGAQVLNPNQFAISPYCGELDMQFNPDTISCQIDITQATALYAGAAVKVVDSAGGVPKVIGCAADSDEVFGFINYDAKSIQFIAGSMCEISQDLNVIYLFSTGAISRGAQVILDLTTMGGVAQATGSSGSTIVGWAFDKFPTSGTLARIKVKTPSYSLDS